MVRALSCILDESALCLKRDVALKAGRVDGTSQKSSRLSSSPYTAKEGSILFFGGVCLLADEVVGNVCERRMQPRPEETSPQGQS